MNTNKILSFVIGFILSCGLFIFSIYITDLINDRIALYIGIIIILILGFVIQRKKIKSLTFGFWVGFIPILLLITGFIVVSSLH